jgi:hypothetical protein
MFNTLAGSLIIGMINNGMNLLESTRTGRKSRLALSSSARLQWMRTVQSPDKTS